MMRPLPLRSHVRHDGSRHPHDSEEVRFEDRPGLLDRTLLRSGRSDTEAGVVHEHVDAAVAPHHFADDGLDGFIARHVEGSISNDRPPAWAPPSAGAVDLVAGLGEPLRRGFADARRCARDERHLAVHDAFLLLLQRPGGAASALRVPDGIAVILLLAGRRKRSAARSARSPCPFWVCPAGRPPGLGPAREAGRRSGPDVALGASSRHHRVGATRVLSAPSRRRPRTYPSRSPAAIRMACLEIRTKASFPDPQSVRTVAVDTSSRSASALPVTSGTPAVVDNRHPAGHRERPGRVGGPVSNHEE